LPNPCHQRDYSRKLKPAVSLGAVGKVIKDMATHSPKKPNDKCHYYKHNKNPKLIAVGVSVNPPPIKIYPHNQRGTVAAECVDAITDRHPARTG
jgi:hypothetical protein